jgi:hypothetical protein
MLDIAANETIIAKCGFELLGEFVLPHLSWWDNYYSPLEARLGRFREEQAADPEKLEMIERIQGEIDIRRKYPEYYGNVFYLLRRPRG